MTLIPIIEICHYCPGIVTAMGVSVGLAGGTIMKQGTPAQMERWGLDLMTGDKVGAWAITEPDSGSDALGGMKSTARRDGDEYVLNGSKTFITNGPYADTIVYYAKLDDGSDVPIRDRQVLTFVLEKGCPASSSPSRSARWDSTPPPPGSCSSTTSGWARTTFSGRPRTSAPGAAGTRPRATS